MDETSPQEEYYAFVSFTRQGIINSVPGIADLSAGKNISEVKGHVKVSARLTLNTGAEIDKNNIELYGPGDITGIQRKAILRTDPEHYCTNFEPNYLAAIEFYEEDLPWCFSPTTINGRDNTARLTPWLALIVVEEKTELEGENPASETQPLPSFSVNKAAASNIFPDPKTLYAWAHVHVNANISSSKNFEDIKGANPDHCYSRILCPRHLFPNKGYYAFLIPTFETGRLAGLGMPVKEVAVNQPAWDWDNSKIVFPNDQAKFPYYYKWYFRTGAMGDFEHLARQLKPREVPETVGLRELFIEDGKEIQQPLYLPGALKIPDIALSPETREKIINNDNWAKADGIHPWQEKLATECHINAEGGEPVIAMPVYGEWHAKVEHLLFKNYPEDKALLSEAERNNWVHQLNLDPRYRAVAALGTKVVQRKQEELMDAAWNQLDNLKFANDTLRYYQLAERINRVFIKNVFEKFTPEQKIFFTVPIHKLVKLESVTKPVTLWKTIFDSNMVRGVMSSAFKKQIRVTERLSRNGIFMQSLLTPPANKSFGSIFKADTVRTTMLKQLNTREVFKKNLTTHLLDQSFKNANPQIRDQIITAIDKGFKRDITIINVFEKNTNFKFIERGEGFRLNTINVQSGNSLRKTKSPAKPAPAQAVQANAQTSVTASLYAQALRNGQAVLTNTYAVPKEEKSDFTLAGAAINQLGKSVNILPVLYKKFGQFDVGKIWESDTTAVPDRVMAYPEFKLPMYEGLKEISHELFLPNINLLPPNSVTLLEENTKFIESYMAGLNHEMSRELLWRGYPTDQRGSYFRRFWNAVDEERNDILEIYNWKSPLGGNATQSGNLLMLAIRGDLLKKYPGTQVYLQSAKRDENKNMLVPDANGLTMEPIVDATVEPDIYFFGFTFNASTGVLKVADLKDKGTHNEGFFFILQERPGEPRFGLDDTSNNAKNTQGSEDGWNNIGWDKFSSAGEIINLKTLEDLAFKVPDKISQKASINTSALIPYCFFQQPVMIAIHAKELLK